MGKVFRGIPRDRRGSHSLRCRVSLRLAKQGYRLRFGDYSDAVLAITRDLVAESGFPWPVEKWDVRAPTYADAQFGAVSCFRLFHHFPNARARRRGVSELCRVAGQYVALPYFRRRRFRLVRYLARGPLFHTLHVALFERAGTASVTPA